MPANESFVPLLSADEMQIWDLGDIDFRETTKWNSDTEGSTSGYDSSLDEYESDEDNDFDSDISCDESSDEEINSDCQEDDEKESYIDDKTEVMNYRSTHALCNQLNYILSVPELCDVTFEVGPNKVPVHGVKAIMGSRSRIFYSLILNAQREKEESSRKKSSKWNKKQKFGNKRLIIEVTKYKPEDFRKIVQFIHCGMLEVDIESLIGVLCGAIQFGLDDLEAACWDFLSRCVDMTSVNKLIESAQQYRQHQITAKIMTKVHEHLKTKKTSNPMKNVNKIETTV